MTPVLLLLLLLLITSVAPVLLLLLLILLLYRGICGRRWWGGHLRLYFIVIVVITITITVIIIIINLGLPSKIKSLLGVHKTTMAGSRSGQKRQFKKIVNATTKFALTAPLTLFGTRVDIWMRKNLASCINFSEKYVKRRFKQFHGKLSISISFNQVGLKGLLRIYLRTVCLIFIKIKSFS